MTLSDSQKWLLLAGGAFLCLLLYWLTPVLTPFFAAALLAYLGDPLADRLERYKLSRTLSVVIVFISLFLMLALVLLLLLPLLEHQISYLFKSVPGYIEVLQTRWLPGLASSLGIEPS